MYLIFTLSLSLLRFMGKSKSAFACRNKKNISFPLAQSHLVQERSKNMVFIVTFLPPVHLAIALLAVFFLAKIHKHRYYLI